MPWHTGRLIVAAPALEDPNFVRAVILVLDHDPDGALGVVLNRASDVRVHDTLADWVGLAADPPVVFGGGPVEPTAVVALGSARPDVPSEGDTAILDRVRLVNLDEDPLLAAAGLEEIRLFAGYAGWGPGQLEDEIDDGAWFPLDADARDVFTASPEQLWHDVLGRQRGALRMLRTFPEDPSAN